jgi:hypothetical protein
MWLNAAPAPALLTQIFHLFLNLKFDFTNFIKKEVFNVPFWLDPGSGLS